MNALNSIYLFHIWNNCMTLDSWGQCPGPPGHSVTWYKLFLLWATRSHVKSIYSIYGIIMMSLSSFFLSASGCLVLWLVDLITWSIWCPWIGQNSYFSFFAYVKTDSIFSTKICFVSKEFLEFCPSNVSDWLTNCALVSRDRISSISLVWHPLQSRSCKRRSGKISTYHAPVSHLDYMSYCFIVASLTVLWFSLSHKFIYDKCGFCT